MNKMALKYCFICLVLFGFVIRANSGMYSWTDKNGVKHFSNKIPPPEYHQDATQSVEIQHNDDYYKKREAEQRLKSQEMNEERTSTSFANDDPEQLYQQELQRYQNMGGDMDKPEVWGVRPVRREAPKRESPEDIRELEERREAERVSDRRRGEIPENEDRNNTLMDSRGNFYYQNDNSMFDSDGNYYHGSQGGGMFNSSTGDYLAPTGGGYMNTRTGEFINK